MDYILWVTLGPNTSGAIKRSQTLMNNHNLKNLLPLGSDALLWWHLKGLDLKINPKTGINDLENLEIDTSLEFCFQPSLSHFRISPQEPSTQIVESDNFITSKSLSQTCIGMFLALLQAKKKIIS